MQVVSLDDTDQPRVLLVDDDALLRRGSGLVLAPHFAVSCAASIEEALADLEREAAAVVISDLDLGEDRDGLSFLEEVAQRWPSTRRVLLTGLNLGPDDPRLKIVQRLAYKPLAASAIVALVSEELAAG